MSTSPDRAEQDEPDSTAHPETSAPASAPAHWSRRSILRTSAAALGGAGVGWSAGAALAPEAGSAAGSGSSGSSTGGSSSGIGVGQQLVSFNGTHQAGITTPAQAHISLVGLDLRPGQGRADLARMMRLLSDDAERLTVGRPALADTEPELAAKPANLTVTFGFGPAAMALTSSTGGTVEPLPAFSTDALVEEWGQTDLVIQLCADDPLTLAHARRMVLKDATSFTTVRWIQNGFLRASGVESEGTTPRNLMGQVDGTINPNEADPDFADLIWSAAPDFTGGTFMVLRRIRTILHTWDQVDRPSREAAIGRNLDNGAPLTGTHEFDDPDLAAVDSFGLPVIDPASHMARAMPRSSREKFLRRPYNYTIADPRQPLGEDAGLLFVAFAASITEQFLPVQKRLAQMDRLNEWTTAIGSAVYAIPPGAAAGEYVGQGMLS